MSSATEATPDRSRSPNRVGGTAGAWVKDITWLVIFLLFEILLLLVYVYLLVFGCLWFPFNLAFRDLSCLQKDPAGRCDLESSSFSSSSETPSDDGEDEYEEEYSYDSPDSDSGGSVTKELNPFQTARSQL